MDSEQKFLNEQLEFLKSKLLDSDCTWDVLNLERRKHYKTEENICTTRKGAKLLYEYLKAGWRLVPPDDYDVHTRILSISDLHYPFCLPYETFIEYGGKVDILQINGDIIDCFSLSKFSKNYRISPIEEMIGIRDYLFNLINMINPKKVIVNYGNHELRLGAYLAKNLDNELQELMPETALDYIFVDGFTHYNRRTGVKTKYEALINVFKDDIEIIYTGNWFNQIGNVLFAHPKVFSSSPMKTAEKALYWFRNEGYSFNTLVLGHTHRVGSYKIGNTMIYEQGCCCETSKMVYNDGKLINSQKEGFMYICLDENGDIMPLKTKIINLN